MLAGCMVSTDINNNYIRLVLVLEREFLLFRVVEIHRICEATATPEKEGANLSESTVIGQIEQ